MIRWTGLLFFSALISGLFLLLHLTAGMMLGPMVAGIIMSIKNRGVTIRPVFFTMAQAILACVVVNSLTFSVLHHILSHWALVLFSVLSVIVVSFTTGAGLAWFGVMPGTTALWGTSPGAASTMVMLCSSFGADSRLTAFMLYFRVIMVAVATSLVSWIVIRTSHKASIAPPPVRGDLLPTLLLIAVSTVIGLRLRSPAATLLLTILAGATAQLSGLFQISAPFWIRIPAYLTIGWSIGLRFTAPVLRYALRSIPAVALSSAILIAICALLAFPVAHFARIDLLSAYLATSPGGLDTIIVISANIPIALPFIIAMQTARMVAVITLGPAIARPLGRWLERHARTTPATEQLAQSPGD
ncbi:AbrB family transcriptional regulator [Bombella sp. TMW 2.2559]|uniref:AbrB family transcriptional regulator n=1 Tax=Bombella dulcis TaxID=2967339 RepID=A0ABT3WFI7_9PROT|nr:AbrB family transcriptional regulator [Bombella dulcis]MCX5616577.1 AbrB family transcriptional regulator [Bombella dulcis]